MVTTAGIAGRALNMTSPERMATGECGIINSDSEIRHKDSRTRDAPGQGSVPFFCGAKPRKEDGEHGIKILGRGNRTVKLHETGRATKSGATGPRTAAGKQRSSRNAVKDALFSQHIILEGETAAAFNKLHRDLREDFQPVGTLEALLVEELATVIWRKRRVLAAESAMIARSPGFVGFVSQPNRGLPHQSALQGAPKDGSEYVSAKLNLLAVAREALEQQRKDIETRGFDPVRVCSALSAVYDYSEFYFQGTLKDLLGGGSPSSAVSNFLGLNFPRKLIVLADAARRSGERSEKLNNEIVELLDSEIIRVVDLWTEMSSKNVVYASLASLVPSEPDIDRIIRSEAHLDRKQDRLLNQLQQLKRARQGHPAPPMIRVDL